MPKELPATVSSAQVVPVLVALRQLGVDSDYVLRRASLDVSVLTAKDARISLDEEAAFWESAVEVSGDRTVGLRVANVLSAGALGGFGYLLSNSETVAKLIERAGRYGRLMDDLSETSLERRNDELFISIGRRGGYPVPGPAAECVVAVALATARRAWPHAHPLAVKFMHSCSSDPAVYRSYFGCPVGFKARATQIVCSVSLLDDVSTSVDPQLGAVLEEHTNHLLLQLPVSEDIVSLARHCLLQQLEQGPTDPDALARRLACSKRTLRRKLQAAHTSYQQLLDDVRQALAIKYVSDTHLSLEQVSDQLRFQDASTFYRAFKRWTGCTPSQYRARKVRIPEP
jgi:AraC-like DNA-binding protein